MGVEELADRHWLDEAMDESDRLGREGFLRKYGRGPSRSLFVRRDGQVYDARPVVVAAYQRAFPHRPPLTHAEMAHDRIRRIIEQHGFEVVSNIGPGRMRFQQLAEVVFAASSDPEASAQSSLRERVISGEATQVLRDLLVDASAFAASLHVEGFGAARQWRAGMPWQRAFTPAVAPEMQSGPCLAVYWALERRQVSLVLTVSLLEDPGQASITADERTISERADAARARLSGRIDSRFAVGPFVPEGAVQVQRAAVAGITYDADAIPGDAVVISDLRQITHLLQVLEGRIEMRDRMVVKIAPGPQGAIWEECRDGGYIAVGWDEVGDLRAYPDERALREAFTNHYAEDYSGNATTIAEKSREVWHLRGVQPGDIVIANRGVAEVLGIGTVIEPGYMWSDARPEYRHTVRVRWDHLGERRIPQQRSWAFQTVAPVPEEVFLEILRVYGRPVSLEEIASRLAAQGLRISPDDLRRYHLGLRTRKFVILAGPSGTGKSWLARAYAEAVGAAWITVPVAPNWTTNEDLIGYFNPIDSSYHDTPFSRFLRDAIDEEETARREQRQARAFHLVLDEMNLARPEYYFAQFLSALEQRRPGGVPEITLGNGEVLRLPDNLHVVGTVNVDETTHGFADKVFDRAQLIELGIEEQALAAHLGNRPYANVLLQVWRAVAEIAPFGFRVADDIAAYIAAGEELGLDWRTLLDEQIDQKILPKFRGADTRMDQALRAIVTIAATEVLPKTQARAARMVDDFQLHGFASYFR